MSPANAIETLTCPEGHQWQLAPGEATRRPSESTCPVCGQSASSQAVTDVHLTTAEPATRPLIPGFELLDELGRGGMGVVYRARQAQPSRLVAVKVMRTFGGDAPSTLARFRAEADAIARLEHPNIVRVYAVGETRDAHYIALELIEGDTLADRLNQGVMPARDAASLIAVLARAVHFAHEREILHRDLKPGNVLLAADGTPKLTDFGLAKRLDLAQGETKTGEILGTVAYMAPEQATGVTRNIGRGCDIHALGAMLYECLTGRRPFIGQETMETLTLVTTAEPVAPRRLDPNIPRDLETIALKCLEKLPRQRYATAAELADDLERWLHNLPIRARPAGTFERAIKWSRRRPAAALTIAVAVLAPLAALAGLVWHNGRLGEQLALTEQQRSRAEFNLTRTQDKLDDLLEQLSTGHLATLPPSSPARSDLLAWSRSLCEQLQARNTDNLHLRWQAARAQRQIADVQRLLGQSTAKAAYDAALKQLGDTAMSPQAPLDYRRELAVALNNRALLEREAGQLEQARADCARAMELWHELERAYPIDELYAARSASTRTNLGLVLQEQGHLKEAEAELQQALMVRERLAKKSPEDASRQLAVAASSINLGQLHFTQQNVSKAEAEFQSAIERLASLPAPRHLTSEFRQQAATSKNNLAAVLAAQSNHREAEIAFRQASDLFESLVAEQPGVFQFRQAWANALCQQAKTLAMLDRQPEGESLLLKSLDLQQELAAEFADRVDGLSQLAAIEHTAADFLNRRNDWDDAKRHLQAGLDADRLAVKLAPRTAVFRVRLRDHLTAAAEWALAHGEITDAAQWSDELAVHAEENLDSLIQAADFMARCIPLAAEIKGQDKIGDIPVDKFCTQRSLELARRILKAGQPAPALPLQLVKVLAENPEFKKLTGEQKHD